MTFVKPFYSQVGAAAVVICLLSMPVLAEEVTSPSQESAVETAGKGAVPRKEPFWHGHKVKADVGFFTAFDSPTRYGGMFELGYEYGWVISKNLYFGLDATWNLFFPDSFRPQNITLNPNSDGSPVPSWVVMLIPIVHSHIGYITPSNTLITLGTAYLWGVIATVRQPISNSFFVEAKGLWWLDRVLGNKGIHDIYFTVGAGIRF